MILRWVPVVVALTGQAVPPPTSPPPAVPPATVQAAPAQSPRPAQRLFNETATAQLVIAKAVHDANEDGIRALIVWCANDNARCAAYDTARKGPGMNLFWADEYKIANVDVGKGEKNADIAKSYGVTLKADDLPFLTVLDGNGKVIANISGRALAASETTFDSAKISAFLKQHQAPNPDANAQFGAALAQAQKDNKVLFLWYTAPW